MSFKVAYCAGHGGNNSTPGKRSPDGEYEWNFNNEVALAFEEAMKQYEGVELLRTDDRTGKTDVPLKTRTDKANAWGADIYISFHENANTAQWGTWTGTETFTYLGSNPKSEKLAACVHPRIIKVYGLNDRGMKKADLHIVRETKMPAILTEGCFMDSTIDIKKLRDHNVLNNAGIATAEGIAEYAGLKKKACQPSQTQKPKEENEMLEKAVVIGGYPDLSMAELVSIRLQAPIFFRSALPSGKIAKEAYVVGGSLDGIQADKVINLTGKDRFGVVDNVREFLK